MPASPCLIVILIAAFAASLALAAAVCSDNSGMMFMIGCRGSTTEMLTVTIDCRTRENDNIGALSRIIDTRYSGACGRDNGAIIQLRGKCTTDVLKYAHTCETGVYRGPIIYRGPATIIGAVDKWRLDDVTFRDIEFTLVGPFGEDNLDCVAMSNCTFTGLD